MPRALPAFAALLLAALDLAPSLAHVLEAPPRLRVWSLELWRDAMFHGQYALFGWLGAPLELGAIAAAGWLAWTLRRRTSARLATAAALGFALALAAWFALVAPQNAILATWDAVALPPDAETVRWRWESGHMACAALKLASFTLLALAVARRAAVAEAQA